MPPRRMPSRPLTNGHHSSSTVVAFRVDDPPLGEVADDTRGIALTVVELRRGNLDGDRQTPNESTPERL